MPNRHNNDNNYSSTQWWHRSYTTAFKPSNRWVAKTLHFSRSSRSSQSIGCHTQASSTTSAFQEATVAESACVCLPYAATCPLVRQSVSQDRFCAAAHSSLHAASCISAAGAAGGAAAAAAVSLSAAGASPAASVWSSCTAHVNRPSSPAQQPWSQM